MYVRSRIFTSGCDEHYIQKQTQSLNVAFSIGTQLSGVLPNMKRFSEDTKEDNTSHWEDKQFVNFTVKLYRPGQALILPGGWGSQISRQSAHECGNSVSPKRRPTLIPRKYPWYFLLDDESTPEPYCGRRDYVNEKFRWPRQVCNVVPQLNQLRQRLTLFIAKWKQCISLHRPSFSDSRFAYAKKKNHKAAQNSCGETGVTWLITFRGWEGWEAHRP